MSEPTTILYRPVSPKELDPIRTVGASVHQELWVPAEELAELNRNIVDQLEVVAGFNNL